MILMNGSRCRHSYECHIHSWLRMSGSFQDTSFILLLGFERRCDVAKCHTKLS